MMPVANLHARDSRTATGTEPELGGADCSIRVVAVRQRVRLGRVNKQVAAPLSQKQVVVGRGLLALQTLLSPMKRVKDLFAEYRVFGKGTLHTNILELLA